MCSLVYLEASLGQLVIVKQCRSVPFKIWTVRIWRVLYNTCNLLNRIIILLNYAKSISSEFFFLLSLLKMTLGISKSETIDVNIDVLNLVIVIPLVILLHSFYNTSKHYFLYFFIAIFLPLLSGVHPKSANRHLSLGRSEFFDAFSSVPHKDEQVCS